MGVNAYVTHTKPVGENAVAGFARIGIVRHCTIFVDGREYSGVGNTEEMALEQARARYRAGHRQWLSEQIAAFTVKSQSTPEKPNEINPGS